MPWSQRMEPLFAESVGCHLQNKAHFSVSLSVSLSLSEAVEEMLVALVAYFDVLHWAEHTNMFRDLLLLFDYK